MFLHTILLSKFLHVFYLDKNSCHNVPLSYNTELFIISFFFIRPNNTVIIRAMNIENSKSLMPKDITVSSHLLHTDGWNLNSLSKKYQKWQYIVCINNENYSRICRVLWMYFVCPVKFRITATLQLTFGTL